MRDSGRAASSAARSTASWVSMRMPSPHRPPTSSRVAVHLLGGAHHRQQDLVRAAPHRLVDLVRGPRPVAVDPAQQPARRGRPHPREVLRGVGVDLGALPQLPPRLAAPLPVDDDPGRAGGDDVGTPARVDGEEEEVHEGSLGFPNHAVSAGLPAGGSGQPGGLLRQLRVEERAGERGPPGRCCGPAGSDGKGRTAPRTVIGDVVPGGRDVGALEPRADRDAAGQVEPDPGVVAVEVDAADAAPTGPVAPSARRAAAARAGGATRARAVGAARAPAASEPSAQDARPSRMSASRTTASPTKVATSRSRGWR